MDQIVADVANNPLSKFVGSADSPATFAARYLVTSLTEDAPVITPRAVQNTLMYRITPGAEEQARAAFAAGEVRYAELGMEGRAFQTVFAGANSGLVFYTMTYDSYEEFDSSFEKLRAAGPPFRILDAAAAGTIVQTSTASTIRVTN